MRVARLEERLVAVPAASGLNPTDNPALEVGGAAFDAKGMPGSSATGSDTQDVSRSGARPSIESEVTLMATPGAGTKTAEQKAEEELKQLAERIAEKAQQADIELDAEQAEAMLLKFKDDNPTAYEKMQKAEADDLTVYADAANPEGVFVKLYDLDYFLDKEVVEEKKEFEKELEEDAEFAKEELAEQEAEFKEEQAEQAEDNKNMREALFDPESRPDHNIGADLEKKPDEEKNLDKDKTNKANDADSSPTPKPSAKKIDPEAEKELEKKSAASSTLGRMPISRKGKNASSSATIGNEDAVNEAAAEARDSFIADVGSAGGDAGADVSKEADTIGAAVAASSVPNAGPRQGPSGSVVKGIAAAAPFSGAAAVLKQEMEADLEKRLDEMGMSGEIGPPRPPQAAGG